MKGGEILDKIVNFQIEEALPEWLEDYSEEKFTVFKTCFLSTSRNSHHFDISEEVLKRDASTILGNFLVAKVRFGDATTHLPSEIIYGYFPKEQEVEFEEVEINNKKIVKAWAYCVVSKQYGQEFNEIFDIKNLRDTSVEMTVQIKDGQEEGEVLSFNIYGLTCLGLSTAGSCPDAMMTMVRFSEEEATNYFNEVNGQHLTDLTKFVNERKRAMADKSYKVDKSKEAMSDDDWGSVDKASMRKKIMDASNKSSLVKSVYALVESGWEEAPSEHLKYPIMQLKGDTFVYNRGALASALGYAKKEKETAVVSKIEKIYKKLGLDSERKGETEKMSKEIEFAAVDLGNLWGALRSAMNSHSWYYYIDGIYEEDNQKFAIITDDNDVSKKYRLDFNYTEDGLTVADEITEIKIDFVPTENVKKFAEPENAEAMKKCEEMPDDSDDEDDDSKEEHDDDSDEEKDEKMSVEDMQAKIDELSRQIEEKENIIMDKENKMSEMSVELESLRNYKATVLARENACAVDALMSEVKPFIDNEKFAEFKAEGLTCTEETFDAWKNKVQAVCFANVSKNLKKNDLGVFAFAAPAENKELKSGSVWDRIKNHNNI